MSARGVIRKATVGVSARTLGGGRHVAPAPAMQAGVLDAGGDRLKHAAAAASESASASGVGAPAADASTDPLSRSVPSPHALTEAEIERRAAEIAGKAVEEQAQAAKQAAHKKGYAEGLAAAEVLARQEIETLRQRAAQLLSGLEAALQNERAASESLALQIALTATGKLLGESAGDAGIVGRLVRQAAAGLHAETRVTVKLGSADTQLLRERAIDLAGSLPTGMRAEIVEDPAIDAGGCIIETDHGSIDARLDTQLQSLCAVLRDVYRGHGARATRTDGESL